MNSPESVAVQESLMCQLCPRTPVHYVPGLHTPCGAGSGVGVKRMRREIADTAAAARPCAAALCANGKTDVIPLTPAFHPHPLPRPARGRGAVFHARFSST